MGTYSLNVPVPPAVRRLASRLEPALTPFRSIRDRPTLVVKRFDGDRSRGVIESLLREELAGVTPFRVRVTGVDAFTDPPTGTAPVVYLTVESRGLRRLHDRLVERVGAVADVEGPGYTPHVTLARGLDDGPDSVDRTATVLRRLEREFEPAVWTADELGVWSREYREIVTRLPL
ncbi:MAG: 2'-5' RNA ligase family protein [Halobaculum sp.]